MLVLSFISGASILFVEAFLGMLAFAEIEKMYTDNFLEYPGIAQIVSFYPLLNMSAVPILTITLRNNLF